MSEEQKVSRSRDLSPTTDAVTSGQSHTPGQRLYSACAESFGYLRGWESGSVGQHKNYEAAAAGFISRDPLLSAASDLLAAVKLSAAQFRMYAELHSAKGTPDGDEKAATNLRYAELCDAAQAKAEGRQ